MSQIVDIKSHIPAVRTEGENKIEVGHKTDHIMEGYISDCCFDGDQVFCLKSVRDKEIYLVDHRTLNVEEIYRFEDYSVRTFMLDRERERIIACVSQSIPDRPYEDLHYIIVADVKTKRICIDKLKPAYDYPDLLYVSRDGQYVYYKTSYGVDSVYYYHIYRINVNTNHNELVYDSGRTAIYTTVCTYDEKYMTIFLHDDGIVTLDMKENTIINQKPCGYFGSIFGIKANPSSTAYTVALASFNGRVFIIDMLSHRIKHSLNAFRFILDQDIDFLNAPLAYEKYGVPTAFISKDGDHLCLLLHEISGFQSYAILIQLSSGSVLAKVESPSRHTISEAFEKRLNSLFSSSDAEQIKHQFRLSVINQNYSEVKGMRLAYCPKSHLFAVGGYENRFKAVINAFDLNTFTALPPIYGNEYLIENVALNDTVLTVEAHTIYRYNTKNKWDITSGVLLDKKKIMNTVKKETPQNLYSHDKYKFYWDKDRNEVTVTDDLGNTLGCVTPKSGRRIMSLSFTNNPDTFYLKEDSHLFTRWEVSKINNEAYSPLEFETKNDAGYAGGIINETRDGRYIVQPEAGYFIDTQSNKKIENDELKNDHEAVIYNAKNNQFVLMRDSSKAVYLRSPEDFSVLAKICLLSNGRFIVQSHRDEIAPNGWLYTNCPDCLNIYAKYSDGTVRVLSPGDRIRENYIKKYNRRDMIKHIVSNSKKYLMLKEGIAVKMGLIKRSRQLAETKYLADK